MAQNESVCICIAAYNAERTIERAVVSALGQAHVTEVIVVDDASRDATAEAARSCDDGSGRLLVNVMERNGGPSVARNWALVRSRASIFCVLDSDDYLLPDRIGRLLAAGRGDWDLLSDDILIVPEHIVGQRPNPLPDEAPRPLLDLDLETFVLANIAVPGKPRGELGFLKPLIRRRFVDKHGLSFDPALRLGEDYALYVRALMAGGKFQVVGFCGYVAVERSNSLSSSHSAADLAALRKFDVSSYGTLTLSEAERIALAAHEQATANRWVLAQALEMRRKDGVGPALRFLAGQRKSSLYVASELLKARSERLRRRLGRHEPARQARHLIGQK